jgi:GntR family transcriptional repressor for pyruvate dehydrogenase complex
MDFKPIKSPRLYEEVIDQIKSLIVEGQISPGDKFPPERKLAAKFEISRGVLREAFRVLEARGFVRSKRGGGRYLRDYQNQNIYRSNNNFIELEKAALLDVVEARKLMETQIVKKATQEATETDLEEISDVLFTIEEADEKEYRDSNLDLEFHMAIARATHNFALQDLLEAQMQLLIDLEQRSFLDPESWKALCDEHKRIYNAILNRDKEKAEKVMNFHMQHLIKAINDIG